MVDFRSLRIGNLYAVLVVAPQHILDLQCGDGIRLVMESQQRLNS